MPGVQVSVHDNGSPFAPPAPETLQPGRRGLSNVRSRVQALGAHCDWKPQAQSQTQTSGTTFTLWLPLDARNIT